MVFTVRPSYAESRREEDTLEMDGLDVTGRGWTYTSGTPSLPSGPPAWWWRRCSNPGRCQPLVVVVTVTPPSGVIPDLARTKPLPLFRVRFMPVVIERQVNGPSVIEVP
jgi:hypothetical protein